MAWEHASLDEGVLPVPGAARIATQLAFITVSQVVTSP
jgi:hypothetical protein